MQVQPVAFMAGGALGAEDDFEFAVRSQFQVIGIVVAEVLARRVGHSHHVGAGGKGQQPDRAAVADHPVDRIAAHRGQLVGVIGVGLEQEHGVQERRPVGVIGIGLEIDEIALREIHQQLLIQLRP